MHHPPSKLGLCCAQLLSALALTLTILSACNFTPSDAGEGHEQTRVALSVQQTQLASQQQSKQSGTDEAQNATLTALAQAQIEAQAATTAAAAQPPAPDLNATQAGLSLQQTQMALQSTQAALSAQQTAAVSGASGAGSSPNPPAPPPSTPITPQALPGRPPPSSQLFEDFSNPDLWPVTNTGTYATGYQGGNYVITVSAPRSDAWAVAGYDFSNTVWVETTAQFLQTSMSSHYGVICRYQDANNFYYFSVQDGGNYFVARYKNGVTKLLGSGKPEYSPAINQAGTNLIQLACIGNELHPSINNVQLGVVVDYEFSRGDVGLIAGAGDMGSMSASFDYILAEE
jgi:hypothetical protein